eukprot:s4346_g4.t1
MDLVCFYNDDPTAAIPLPYGETARQVCKYRSTWLVRAENQPGAKWRVYEWGVETINLDMSDFEYFSMDFDPARHVAAVHFFSRVPMGAQGSQWIHDQLTHAFNHAVFSKRAFLMALEMNETPIRTANRPVSGSASSVPMDLRRNYGHVEYVVSHEDMVFHDDVAGVTWHEAQRRHLGRLQPVEYPERAKFQFGPEQPKVSKMRWAYPCGLGGHFAVLWVSEVSAHAPA